jgi:hypothetical protein
MHQQMGNNSFYVFHQEYFRFWILVF